VRREREKPGFAHTSKGGAVKRCKYSTEGSVHLWERGHCEREMDEVLEKIEAKKG